MTTVVEETEELDPREVLDALLDLREAYAAAVGGEVAVKHPAMGCCGCGAVLADVLTAPEPPEAPFGEGYCWSCVDAPDWPIDAKYVVLPGRARTFEADE